MCVCVLSCCVRSGEEGMEIVVSDDDDADMANGASNSTSQDR